VTIDFGRTAQDYARHRAGFPDELFVRLERFDIGHRGQRILDLGTGTGTLARGFARRGALVTGLDRAETLMAEARRLDAAAGVTIDYRTGMAEDTGLPAGSFDVVAAGQCWHWFDRPKAAEECRRLLVANGRLVVCHFDWVPLPGNLVAATEALILKHNPSWSMGGGTGLYPAWLADAAMAGFRNIETFSFDMDVPYTPESWRGRIRASAGVAASLPADAVERFDREHADLLAGTFPGDVLPVPHRCWAMVATAP